MKNKAQMDVKGVFLTFIIAALIAIVGVMVYSNVSNTSNQLFDNVDTVTSNESVTISATKPGDDNSTLLAEDGFILNSETVLNASNSYLLTRNVDYNISLQQGASGVLSTRANFTLLNVTNSTVDDGGGGFNNSALRVTYHTNEKSDARLSKESMDTTVLDSFDLGVIAILVLAAVMLLGFLFWMGGKT